MTTKEFLLTSLISIGSIVVFGQTEEPIPPPPPPMEMAMPKGINIKVVDEIIRVSNHEKYFIDYCTEKVNRFARSHNWTTQKTNQILKSIKFGFYNSTIYNSYATYSTEELNKILEALTILNNKFKSDLPMVLTNSMMQSNLDLFVEDLIAGKYVTSG